MKDADNIRILDDMDIDWMGFIFYQRSPRNVEQKPVYLPIKTKRVGVFVNEEIDKIACITKDFGLDIIQLHGNESPEFCAQLNQKLERNNQKFECKALIIKSMQISSETDIAKTEKYERVIDYFLFETKCDTYGGSGKHFNWNIVHHYQGKKPFILTGGICYEDIDKIIQFKHPKFLGIDINSCFELTPGMKDEQLIKRFVNELRNKTIKSEEK